MAEKKELVAMAEKVYSVAMQYICSCRGTQCIFSCHGNIYLVVAQRVGFTCSGKKEEFPFAWNLFVDLHYRKF